MTRPRAGGLVGLLGRPFVDLEPWVDLDALAALDDEICRALAVLPVDYTGGSHRSMGIMPPSREHEAGVDYGEVIAALDDAAFRELLILGDDPRAVDEIARKRDAIELGEERDVPLNRRQLRWLELKHRVYFPWKVYYELIPNRLWEEKSSAAGKDFTDEARAHFPRTIAFLRTLPFVEIGRCNVMGLAPHDHGTTHRDGDPAVKTWVDHFLLLAPRKGKRPFLWDEARGRKLHIPSRAYWFNDSDYHGVEADPYFRYSLRIDGIFAPELLTRLERELQRK